MGDGRFGELLDFLLRRRRHAVRRAVVAAERRDCLPQSPPWRSPPADVDVADRLPTHVSRSAITSAIVCCRSSGFLATIFWNTASNCGGTSERAWQSDGMGDLLMRDENLHQGLALVQHLAGQKPIERAAQRIDVGPGVGMVGVHRLLGSHVVAGAHHLAAGGQPVLVLLVRQSRDPCQAPCRGF